MTPQQRIRAAIETINDIVHTSATWHDKKQLFVDEASDDERASLEEFAIWFSVDVGERK